MGDDAAAAEVAQRIDGPGDGGGSTGAGTRNQSCQYTTMILPPIRHLYCCGFWFRGGTWLWLAPARPDSRGNALALNFAHFEAVWHQGSIAAPSARPWWSAAVVKVEVDGQGKNLHLGHRFIPPPLDFRGGGRGGQGIWRKPGERSLRPCFRIPPDSYFYPDDLDHILSDPVVVRKNGGQGGGQGSPEWPRNPDHFWPWRARGTPMVVRAQTPTLTTARRFAAYLNRAIRAARRALTSSALTTSATGGLTGSISTDAASPPRCSTRTPGRAAAKAARHLASDGSLYRC